MRARASALIIGFLLLQPLLTSAAKFPDVPNGHIHQTAIEKLAERGVIKGNPDGTFNPEGPVNRAAMLIMLYRAANRTPAPLPGKCFIDVPDDSWFGPTVCDAVKNRFVQGYNDGRFKPEQFVTRAEAVKMVLTVLGIPVPEFNDADRQVVKHVDLSPAGWYMKYLVAAFKRRMLPVAGQEGARFEPDTPLKRSEAAAYIWAALQVGPESGSMSSAAASTAASQASAASAISSTSAASMMAKSSAPSAPAAIAIALPYARMHSFTEKKPSSYLINVRENMVLSVSVKLSQKTGSVSCQLYRIENDGFSQQYHLGYQEGFGCFIRAAATPGNYQLQMQPTVANAAYALDVKAGKGDGHDGFSQAKVLQKAKLRSDFLDANDYEDWFTFTVPLEGSYTVEVKSSQVLRCLVYAMDVDIFGFSGPECGKSYIYPPGTYYISIGQAYPAATKKTYSVQWR